MLKTAEAVSLGHPDKTADYISSFLLDELLVQDSSVRYAVEVMIKDNTVIFAGEVSGNIVMPDLSQIAKKALADIGYTREYSAYWKENAINPDKLKIIDLIGAQSSGIAQGVAQNGWGDQGVFVGYACQESEDGLPLELSMARKLNSSLYKKALEDKHLGLDIKTQVTIDEKGKIDTVIVAIPMLNKEDRRGEIIDLIFNLFNQTINRVVVNGTGSYEAHGSVADCGVTGRKLACDFYSTACPIGGGSPWGKDASKADVTLNYIAQKMARAELKENDECYVYLSSCIGQSILPSAEMRCKKNNVETKENITIFDTPQKMIENLGLNKPVFKELCKGSVGLK